MTRACLMAVFAVGIPLSARAVVLHTPTTPEERTEQTDIAALVQKVNGLIADQAALKRRMETMIANLPSDSALKAKTLHAANMELVEYLDNEKKKAKAAEDAIQRTNLLYGIDPGGTTAPDGSVRPHMHVSFNNHLVHEWCEISGQEWLREKRSVACPAPDAPSAGDGSGGSR